MSKVLGRWSPWWTVDRLDLAERLYRTSLDSPAEMLRAINEVDTDAPPVPRWTAVTSWMTSHNIPRRKEAITRASVVAAAQRDALIVETIRKMVAEGATNPQIVAEIGRPMGSLIRIMKRNNIVRASLKPKAVAKVEKPKRVRLYAEAAAPAKTKPKPTYQTVEEFERNGGIITKLPAAILANTQARLSEEDQAQLAAYTMRMGGYDRPWGNWRDQKRAGRW